MRKQLLIACMLIMACAAAIAQPYNRIQYHDFHWRVFHTGTFHIYFPQGNDSLCAFIAREYTTAEKRIEQHMGTSLAEVPNIILYPSIDQLYETNIGSEEQKDITLPTFVLKGNRMLLYFNGSYEHLKSQLNETIARSIWEQQTNNLTDQVAGATGQSHIPYWFKEGAVRYIAHEWPIKAEEDLYRSFNGHAYNNWEEVIAGQPALAGQAFCYFLSEKFLRTAVMQTYFQIRKRKTLPAALRLVTKTRIDSLYIQCFNFYKGRYAGIYVANDTAKFPVVIPHGKGIVREVFPPRSAQQPWFVYVLATPHKRTVFCCNKVSKTTIKLVNYPMPPWIADHTGDNYPLITWAVKDNELLITRPKKGTLSTGRYTVDGSLTSRYTLAPADGINRLMPDGNEYLDLIGWTQAKLDTVRFDTRRNKFIPSHRFPSTDKQMQWKADNDSLYISSVEEDLDRYKKVSALWFSENHQKAVQQAKEDSILNAAKDETPGFLDGVFNSKNGKEQTQKRQDSLQHSLEYDPKKVQSYVLQLHSAYFSAKVNNDYYVNRYQPYLNYQGQFKFPEIGGMAQGGFSDLFENLHFTVAYRMPAGTEGSDFFAKYRNTAKRLDWGVTYFRKVENLQPDPKRNWVDNEGRSYPNTAKVKTNYYEVALHYPLSYYSSLNLTSALRNDRTIFLATETYSLKFAALQSNWSISTLSYEINKLRSTLPMLYKGFSVKAGVDLFKGFSQKEQTLTGNTIRVLYHQPLYRYITLVTGLQAGYRGGDAKVLYNLGGVDNNITPRIDSNVHFLQDAPYAFITLVTPFRGYFQSSLFGNEYALLNIDVYFPLFQTLIPVETPLSAINDLQLGIFTDIATAKETWQKPVVNNGIKSVYGFSARTTLAGYPLRFDMAWPGDGGKPVWYLSLNAVMSR